MTTMVKPIEQTAEIKGKYADDFIKDVYRKPSLSATEKNKKAVQLLKKMRG